MSILSHKHRFLYVHVAKTGGSSVDLALQGWCPRSEHFSTRTLDHRIDILGRRIAMEIRRHSTPQQWDSYYKFAFVRNPWDRAVSIFKNIQSSREMQAKDKRQILEEITRRLGIDEEDFTFDVFVKDVLRDRVFDNYHWDKQIYCFSDYDNRNLLDFIGRYENLQDDFNAICRNLRFTTSRLPHVNKTQHDHYSSYYSKETEQIVGDLYREDVERFQYRFEKPGRIPAYVVPVAKPEPKPLVIRTHFRPKQDYPSAVNDLLLLAASWHRYAADIAGLEVITSKELSKELASFLKELGAHVLERHPVCLDPSRVLLIDPRSCFVSQPSELAEVNSARVCASRVEDRKNPGTVFFPAEFYNRAKREFGRNTTVDDLDWLPLAYDCQPSDIVEGTFLLRSVRVIRFSEGRGGSSLWPSTRLRQQWEEHLRQPLELLRGTLAEKQFAKRAVVVNTCRSRLLSVIRDYQLNRRARRIFSQTLPASWLMNVPFLIAVQNKRLVRSVVRRVRHGRKAA